LRLLSIPEITIGGIPIAVTDVATSARLMVDAALSGRNTARPPLVVTAADRSVVSLCARARAVRVAFLDADLIHAQDTSLLLASYISPVRLPERIGILRLFHAVAQLAEARNAEFYFLGSDALAVRQAVSCALRLYPGLTISGHRNGFASADEASKAIDEINAARPDILWPGMGVPADQFFAMENRRRLCGVELICTAGALFPALARSTAVRV
jgi:UDP-N-acetyl-D-mannosaminuronic acid transferase (WecB/TagA/CpsF family)